MTAEAPDPPTTPATQPEAATEAARGIDPQGHEAKPWWKRPLAWVTAAVLAGAAGVITGAVQSGAGWVAGHFQDHSNVSVIPTLTPASETCTGGSGWVFGETTDSLSMPPTDPRDQAAWAAKYRGLQASPELLTLLVINNGKGDAVVTAVEPTNIQGSEPIRGTHGYAMEGCGGGAVDTVQFSFNMDSAAKGERIRPVDSNAAPVFPRNVPSGSPDEYDITIFANDRNYTFDLHITVQGPEGSSDLILDNGGRHYVLASTQLSTHANGAPGEWRVEEDPFILTK
jgi:hypothetical protein